MSKFDLAQLNDKTKVVTDIVKGLSDFTGQDIPFVTVDKVKRVAGISTRTVNLRFEGNQIVSLLFRASGDVYRVQLNGKDFPMAGELNPDYKPAMKEAIAEIGDAVRSGQAKFSKKQAMVKVAIPKATNGVQTTRQKLTDASAQEKAIDSEISELNARKADLQAKLDSITKAA